MVNQPTSAYLEGEQNEKYCCKLNDLAANPTLGPSPPQATV